MSGEKVPSDVLGIYVLEPRVEDVAEFGVRLPNNDEETGASFLIHPFLAVCFELAEAALKFRGVVGSEALF